MNGSHFDPLGWDTNPEAPAAPETGKQYRLAFECGGDFTWMGKAPTLKAAEAKARAELAGQYHTFSPQAARLTAMECIA